MIGVSVASEYASGVSSSTGSVVEVCAIELQAVKKSKVRRMKIRILSAGRRFVGWSLIGWRRFICWRLICGHLLLDGFGAGQPLRRAVLEEFLRVRVLVHPLLNFLFAHLLGIGGRLIFLDG